VFGYGQFFRIGRLRNLGTRFKISQLVQNSANFSTRLTEMCCCVILIILKHSLVSMIHFTKQFRMLTTVKISRLCCQYKLSQIFIMYQMKFIVMKNLNSLHNFHFLVQVFLKHFYLICFSWASTAQMLLLPQIKYFLNMLKILNLLNLNQLHFDIFPSTPYYLPAPKNFPQLLTEYLTCDKISLHRYEY
jgi:hypothetical protein